MSITPLRRERTPESPGPGPLPEGLLRALDLRIGRRLDGLLAGEHRTAALGVGAELAQIREWEPGDDMQRIDWNATARSGDVQVRVDVAERALTSWVLLDVSPTMRFGTADRRKWDVAEGVAVAVGHLASRRGNRVGVATFGGTTSLMLRPRQGRVGLLGVLLAVRRDPETERVGRTSIGSAHTQVARVARQRSLTVVVSDFRGPRDWRAPLLRLASRHAVVAVEIRDVREQELPRWPGRRRVVAVPRDDATVVLTMDSSASMTATDVAPTRLEAAKSAASSFLDRLPDRCRTSLVSFSSSVQVLEEPTDDRDAVRTSLDSIQGDVGTALGDALVTSVDLDPDPEEQEKLSGGKPLFAVLLLSDGANSTGSEPLNVLDDVKKTGVPVYTIALGTDSRTAEITNDFGQTETYAVPPDRETLKTIAQETGGRYFEAPTESDLWRCTSRSARRSRTRTRSAS